MGGQFFEEYDGSAPHILQEMGCLYVVGNVSGHERIHPKVILGQSPKQRNDP